VKPPPSLSPPSHSIHVINVISVRDLGSQSSALCVAPQIQPSTYRDDGRAGRNWHGVLMNYEQRQVKSASLHCIFYTPFPSILIVLLSICLQQLRDFGNQRIIGIRICQQRTNREQDLKAKETREMRGEAGKKILNL
jgi:hypothetical protein